MIIEMRQTQGRQSKRERGISATDPVALQSCSWRIKISLWSSISKSPYVITVSPLEVAYLCFWLLWQSSSHPWCPNILGDRPTRKYTHTCLYCLNCRGPLNLTWKGFAQLSVNISPNIASASSCLSFPSRIWIKANSRFCSDPEWHREVVLRGGVGEEERERSIFHLLTQSPSGHKMRLHQRTPSWLPTEMPGAQVLRLSSLVC